VHNLYLWCSRTYQKCGIPTTCIPCCFIAQILDLWSALLRIKQICALFFLSCSAGTCEMFCPTYNLNHEVFRAI